VLLDRLEADPVEFAERTGWDVKSEGACRGEVCVPLPPGARRANGQLDVRVVADRLGMPLVLDEAHHLWALGPETAVNGRALPSAAAPDPVLPDVHGRQFRLSGLRGQKVVLVAWASW
jgi:hypothetical protein